MQLYRTIHYCKADKKSGKPVIITTPDGETRNTDKWKMDLYDKKGKPVRIEVVFMNSEKKAKAQGATTVLKVFR